MKIVWLHAHFLNWMGGHTFIYEVASRIRKKYGIDIFSSVSNNGARVKFMQKNIKLYDLSGKSTNDPFFWLNLNKYIQREEELLDKYIKDYDVVISSHFPLNVIGNKFNKPHIYCCWEPYAFFHDENYIKGFNLLQQIFIRLMGIFYKNIDIAATKRVDKIITLSKFNKDWINKIYGRDDAVISYEGVDTDFFKHKNNKQLSEKYKDYKIIMHSTDFTTIKGTEYLIKSLPLIKKEIKNFKLLITHTLKNTDKKKKIEDLAISLGVIDDIEFLGRVDYELLPAFYSLSDVVVQPSINQSMSLSVKESMSCGTPVVTSIEGYEQTKDGEAGYLVDPTNVKELAQAVVKLLKNEKIADKMGKKGRQIIMKKFSWDAVASVFIQQIEDLYE